MVFIATPQLEKETFDYILGDYFKGMSIAVDRYYHLLEMNYKEPLKIALRDPFNNKWTKWVEFPGYLIEPSNKWGSSSGLNAAVDVHRSILKNEIVIESDYPTYEENYDASKIIGKMLENKGWNPHYYYSGNKSIHIHIYFDWDCLKQLNILTQNHFRMIFKESHLRIKNKFIEWLRTLMISCWGTKVKQFDEDLIKGSHLIRSELSKNKRGYKTFIGYTHKDLSFVPYVCNEKNRIYPKIGKIKLSSPPKLNELMTEFLKHLIIDKKTKLAKKKNKTLFEFGLSNPSGKIRNGVKSILSNDFRKLNDGYHRAMFILLNELRNALGDSQAEIVIKDWNNRMGNPIEEKEIDYRLNRKLFQPFSLHYINSFLKEIGFVSSQKQ